MSAEAGRAAASAAALELAIRERPGTQTAAVRRGLVDVVRDFLAVHQQLTRLFEGFRNGTLRFDDVRAFVADDESSPLFRLKERVHALFRGETDTGQPLHGAGLRRGEALFDLAVGSLFHEALKFRENFYQLEVYAPRVVSLRDEGGGEADELLREFEKILRGASERVDESLDEAETLLGQMRRQLLVLLVDASEEKSGGLVARYLIAHREEVELVYPEGLDVLLRRLHGDVPAAYLCAIRSQLDSARFDQAIALIALARERLLTERRGAETSPAAQEADRELDVLDAYASGMQAFLMADYTESATKLGAWLDLAGENVGSAHVELAWAAQSRVPELIAAGNGAAETAEATRLAARLAALRAEIAEA